MEMVQTVKGRINPSHLGITYSHEHLITNPPEPAVSEDPDLMLSDVERATAELQHFSMAGGNTLVEMTTVDYGRNISMISEIAECVNIHIVVATGFLKGEYCEYHVADKSVNQLADVMIDEIENGIDGTGIRAGVIKAGSSLNKISESEEKVLRAAARAHCETGAPISTHTQAGTMGLAQVKILRQEGAEPSKIILGHVDRNLDWDYHKQLIDSGVNLGYDQISKEKYFPDKLRIEFILRLFREEHHKRILLSADLGRRSYWVSYGGGPGLTYILWRFIPWLRSEGLPQEAIDALLINNPRRIFSF